MSEAKDIVVSWLWSGSWQLVLLVPLLALTWRFTRNQSAHWRYLLGVVVLIKCLLPAVPWPWTPPGLWSPSELLRAARAELPTEASPGKTSRLAGKGSQKSWVASIQQEKLIMLLWGCGAAALLGGVVAQAIRVERDLRRSRREPDLDLECEFLEIARTLGLGWRPPLRLVGTVTQPFVWGLARGAIYLPASFPKVGNSRERRVVLAHELAHVLRWDAFINAIQVFAQAVFWFHPAMWWLNSKLRHEREKCCDEMAIASLGMAASEYGSAVVEHLVARFTPATPPSSLAMTGRTAQLEDRLRSLLRPGKRFHLKPTVSAVLTALLAGVALLPLSFDAAPEQRLRSSSSHPIDLELASARTAADHIEESPYMELASGRQKLGGVDWFITHPVAVRGERRWRLEHPSSFRHLHLLHSTAAAAMESAAIAHIILRYEDDSSARLDVRYGEHLRTGVFQAFEPVRDPRSATAWTGANPQTRAAGQALRLYRSTLLNPAPDKRVTEVSIKPEPDQPMAWLAGARLE